MSALSMNSEMGIYVDGVWHVWLPETSGAIVSENGWKSPAEAVAYWKTLDRKFVPYLNGREIPWSGMTGGVQLEDGTYSAGPIMQRVWFEGESTNGQLEFDFSEVAA